MKSNTRIYFVPLGFSVHISGSKHRISLIFGQSPYFRALLIPTKFQTNWSLTFGVAPIASGTKYILVFDFISQLLDIEISLNFAGTP